MCVCCARAVCTIVKLLDAEVIELHCRVSPSSSLRIAVVEFLVSELHKSKILMCKARDHSASSYGLTPKLVLRFALPMFRVCAFRPVSVRFSISACDGFIRECVVYL